MSCRRNGFRKQVSEGKGGLLELRRKSKVKGHTCGEEEGGGKGVGVLPRGKAP